LLTPICKAFCTDRGFESTIQAIQCLGGYGYTSEYDAEQFARDAKIGSIYEGTNYIQAQDFLSRKIPMAGGAVFAAYMKLIGADLDAVSKNERLAPYAAMVREAKETFEKAMAYLVETERSDEKGFLSYLHAVDAVSMMGDVCVSHQLLKEADLAYKALDAAFSAAGAAGEDARRKLIDSDDEARYYYGKTRAAMFYVTQVLPGVYAKARAAHSPDTSAIDPGL
jgi:hypothetical protein